MIADYDVIEWGTGALLALIAAQEAPVAKREPYRKRAA
jgi:hypothetical protein